MDTTEQFQKPIENLVSERSKGLDSLRAQLPQAPVFAFVEKNDCCRKHNNFQNPFAFKFYN